MILDIVFILSLIAVNGLFALSEFAVVSSRRSRLRFWASRGDQKSRVALELAEDPTRFLSTIQVGISLIGVLAGAFSGAAFSSRIAGWLSGVPLLAPFAESLSMGLVVLGITYLMLVFGELVPKQLGLNAPERFASLVAIPMHILSIIAYPVVWFLSASTGVVLRTFGTRPTRGPRVTEEEISMMLEDGREEGIFEEEEPELVRSIFRLADRRISVLITPRTDIVALDIDKPRDENWTTMNETRHSHYPVYREYRENIVGVVSVKDLWAEVVRGETPEIRTVMKRPNIVPESVSVLHALEIFKTTGSQVLLVCDEYGSIIGLVTHHDVLESIIGDLPAYREEAGFPAVQEVEAGWIIDGMFPLDQLKEVIGVVEIPGEESLFQTTGGFVMMHLERVPEPGDSFEWADFRFTVLDMDGKRVDRVRVERRDGADRV
ncbi:MAG: hemolysin family protein [Methanomicrobiales archaeon]